MANARIGDEFLKVFLGECYKSAVDNSDYCYGYEDRQVFDRGLGEKRHQEPDKAVRAHLKEHCRKDYTSRRGRFYVRVGQPRVEREHRHFDCKRQEEGKERQPLRAQYAGERQRHLVEVHNVHGRCAELLEVREKEVKDCDQHERASKRGVYKELHSGVNPPLLNGFVGEFLILLGAFEFNYIYAVLGATGIILGAVYMLWAYQRVMFGPLDKAANKVLKDINAREILVLLPLAIMMFVMGIYPKPFLDKMEPSVQALLDVKDEDAEHHHP